MAFVRVMKVDTVYPSAKIILIVHVVKNVLMEAVDPYVLSKINVRRDRHVHKVFASQVAIMTEIVEKI